MRTRALAVLALAMVVAMGLAGSARAIGWTVQTVAVRDLRVAELLVDDLTQAGYDGYTEFTMGTDGLQWVRVRVGCFHGPAGAQAMAALLRATDVPDAVAVERTPGAPARGCLRRQIGFVAPDGLEQPEPGVPRFVVEVAGVRGVVRYMEGRWRVLQGPAADASPPGVQGERRYRQVQVAERPYVRVRHQDGEFFLCPGRALAELDGAVVVEDQGVVLACSWTDPVVVEARP